MKYLTVFCAVLVSASAQQAPLPYHRNNANQHRNPWSDPSQKGEMVIENKNVNIIVNVDPKEVADELWKIIQSHINDRNNRRSFYRRSAVDDLERAVEPFLPATRRRTLPRPSPSLLAHDFEGIARRAISGDEYERNTIDDEILVKDIVGDMMRSLKQRLVDASESPQAAPEKSVAFGRRMEHPLEDDEEYAVLRVKVPRRDISDMLQRRT